MKIGEKVGFDDGKIIVQKRFANDPYIEQVKQLKDQGIDGFGENKLVGRIPVHLLAEWIKEAGLKWDDTQAVSDMMRKRLLSGDFDKLRVWEGTF